MYVHKLSGTVRQCNLRTSQKHTFSLYKENLSCFQTPCRRKWRSQNYPLRYVAVMPQTTCGTDWPRRYKKQFLLIFPRDLFSVYTSIKRLQCFMDITIDCYEKAAASLGRHLLQGKVHTVTGSECHTDRPERCWSRTKCQCNVTPIDVRIIINLKAWTLERAGALKGHADCTSNCIQSYSGTQDQSVPDVQDKT